MIKITRNIHFYEIVKQLQRKINDICNIWNLNEKTQTNQ